MTSVRSPFVDPAPGTGVVVELDEPAGLGRIAASGGLELAFHCTAVADGSRSVPLGARVAFRVAAAHGGGWQATEVVAV